MKAEKKRSIMAAAEVLFSQGRFHETTMEAIAREAGVGKGTLYRYFEDKEALFRAVAASGFDELCNMVRTECERSADFRTCLLNVCRRVTVFYRRRRRVMHMIQTEERRIIRQGGIARAEWMARRRELVGAVTSILNDGRKRGRIRRDVPLTVLASVLLGMLRAGGRAERFGDGFDAGHHGTVVDLFLNGAAPGSGSHGQDKMGKSV